MRGLWITDSRGSNTLARFDPSPAGVQRGGGGAQCSEHRDIFVRLYLPLFKTAKVWSVALVAHRGELVLIIQTDGPLGELMLWDYLTSLGSTVLWVTWQEMRGGFFFLMHHSYVSAGNWVPAAISLLFWNGFQMWAQAEVVKHFLNWSHRWKSLFFFL